jgi:signal transduction histidine kinase/ActR/RegA family two-component response regulator
MTPKRRWAQFRTSFQFKLLFIFTLLTFLISCLLSTLYIISETGKTRQHASEKLRLRAESLAGSIRLPLYAENRDMLRLLAEQAAREPEILAVVISATDGRILADVRVPGYLPDPAESPDIIKVTAEVRTNPLAESVDSAINGAGNTTSPTLLGSVRLERGTADLSRAVRQVVAFSISSAFAFWMAVSLFCLLILNRLTRSFNALVAGIEAFHDGDFSHRITIESADEPGRVASAVNNLAVTLQQREAENSRLLDEQHEFERQLLHAQKLESMGVMAGGIAHDFNNLLQAILGNMELADRELSPDSRSRKYVGRAIESAQQAAHLTDLMLTYVGKGYVAKKTLDLNNLVRNNADMLKTAATASVSIKLNLSEELLVILANEAQIQQVVMNLITNAAESIEKQPGLIRLTTGIRECEPDCLTASLLEEKPPAGCYAFLEVQDNGCGMSDETKSRLFDPFFTTKFTGRGLGMSAVMGIIKSHGGALFLESEVGRGSTFRVLFPLTEGAESEKSKSLPHPHPNLPLEGEGTNTKLHSKDVSSPNASIGDPALKPGFPITSSGMTNNLLNTACYEIDTSPERPLSGLVLVVDDEKAVMKVCVTIVKNCGFTVITAVDGSEAVAKFREHADEIVIVLMDLTMPNTDGLTAMNEIHAIKPDARVIIASGFNEEDMNLNITNLPPSGFIRKPYSMKALEAELRRVMQESSTA